MALGVDRVDRDAAYEATLEATHVVDCFSDSFFDRRTALEV
jgi:hypothetical protein